VILSIVIFLVALSVLLFSAQKFTGAAESIGTWLKLPPFVVGIFIVGIGTSLPELISGIISTQNGSSEIIAGNIIGANISNILLITGLAAVLYRKTITLTTEYLYIDLHFLLGCFMYFAIIAFDGKIEFLESIMGAVIFVIYAFYLIKGGEIFDEKSTTVAPKTPFIPLLILVLASVGIYFGADYTIAALNDIAIGFGIPKSIIAVTVLSLGTTLPELAVIVSAIRKGNVQMAIGNVLGSCLFNTLMIPPIVSAIGVIEVPNTLLYFSLPVMLASGLLFYLLTQDKKISVWEGMMFVCLYVLFILKIVS